jgi:phosphoribosylformimino-5-aminoimidazole carboxamide ribotide isomerase
MLIIPAVYILDGQCVTLYKGDVKQKDVFTRSPVQYAKEFKTKNASTLFLIDLNASEYNQDTNVELIEKIRRDVDVSLILAGRIRTMEEVDKWFDLGFEQLVLGVSAEPIYKTAIDKYGPEKIIVGIKSKGDEVQTEKETRFPIRVIDFAEKLPKLGVKKVMFKDLWKEGTKIGPNYDEVDRMIQMLSLQVYVSGGIGEHKHLKLLKKVGAHAAVVGKAYYERDLYVSENVSEFE